MASPHPPAPFPVQPKATPGPAPEGMGTGLFASSDIATGQDVLHIKVPFVAVLDTARLEDTCSGCFGKKQFENDQIELKSCTGCQVVRYCDKVWIFPFLLTFTSTMASFPFVFFDSDGLA